MGTAPKVFKFNKEYLESCINKMEGFTPKTLRDEYHLEAYLFTLRELLAMLEDGSLLGYQEPDKESKL